MEDSLVKLCSDKVAHAKFKQLYGERPDDKAKGLQHDQQKVAFHLAWESCKKVMKERIEQEIREFFAETEAEYVWINSKGEEFINKLYLEEFRA